MLILDLIAMAFSFGIAYNSDRVIMHFFDHLKNIKAAVSSTSLIKKAIDI
jgi:hypothetical protein